jgi:hypothetical protein
MLFQGLRKVLHGSQRLHRVSQRFYYLEHFQNRKKEDAFRKEINHLLNKPAFTLRDYKEKVRKDLVC